MLDNPGILGFGARRNLSTPSFDEDIALVLDALRGAGFDGATVVNLTREDLGIPVVKVIVTGLGVGLHARRERRRERGAIPGAEPPQRA